MKTQFQNIVSELGRIRRYSKQFTSVEGPQHWTSAQRNALHVYCRAAMIEEAIESVLNRTAIAKAKGETL